MVAILTSTIKANFTGRHTKVSTILKIKYYYINLLKTKYYFINLLKTKYYLINLLKTTYILCSTIFIRLTSGNLPVI